MSVCVCLSVHDSMRPAMCATVTSHFQVPHPPTADALIWDVTRHWFSSQGHESVCVCVCVCVWLCACVCACASVYAWIDRGAWLAPTVLTTGKLDQDATKNTSSCLSARGLWRHILSSWMSTVAVVSWLNVPPSFPLTLFVSTLYAATLIPEAVNSCRVLHESISIL